MAKKSTGKAKAQTAAEVGKEKALEMALQQIRKDFGESALMKLGDKKCMQVDAVSTGNIAIDAALGVGGLPRGRITEIYGPESSGKTTLALHCVAEVQKAGGTAAYIDAEHALDPIYAQKLGVNIDELFVCQPDSGEQALDITEALVRSGAIDIVVIDSVAALVPKAEIEGDMGDSHVGLQARLMSQALRKLAGVIAQHQRNRDLHQPAARKGGADGATAIARNHHGRQGAEVLCLRKNRCAQDRDAEGLGRYAHWQPHAA